jgi:hypothetical protein
VIYASATTTAGDPGQTVGIPMVGGTYGEGFFPNPGQGQANQQQNSPSATVGCATPTSFRQVGAGQDVGYGKLSFTYAWASTSGSNKDLTTCKISENVQYPGLNNPYHADSPPFPAASSFINPTVLLNSATNEGFTDTHYLVPQPQVPAPFFVAPLMPDSFTAYQSYGWQCSCFNAGNAQYFAGFVNIPIVRKVIRNQDGTFSYVVTKSGSSATINPIQTH